MTAPVPGLLDRADRELLRARKRAAALLVGEDGPAASRVDAAPDPYALVHHVSEMARHCQLLTPLPGRGEVRVIVTPGRAAGEWHVDVAGRDRPGLLAAFTGVLAAGAFDVTQAVVATWDDGAALQALVLRSTTAPDPADLQSRFRESLARPPAWSRVVDAEIVFDDSASPLYTACRVRAPDRPGLLHDLASGMSAAGVDIHSARATTVAGAATDHFDLTDGAGAKLDAARKSAVLEAVRTGAADAGPRRRRSRLFSPGSPRPRSASRRGSGRR